MTHAVLAKAVDDLKDYGVQLPVHWRYAYYSKYKMTADFDHSSTVFGRGESTTSTIPALHYEAECVGGERARDIRKPKSPALI